METKNFLGLDGLNHFWEKAKIWIINEITAKIAGIVLSSVPTGTVLQGLYTTVPNGFLLCNGTAYLRTEYPKLFAEISTIYNLPTDSADIFRVPDLRNRTVMGANPNIAGKAKGKTSNVGDVQLAEVPAIIGLSGRVASMDIDINEGAMYLTKYKIGGGWDSNSENYSCRVGFNSARSGASTDHLGNLVYSDRGEVRSANIRMNYIIRY